MLEICGVVDARRQQNNRWIGGSRRCNFLQRLKQMARIVTDRTNIILIEDLRKCAFHDLAILKNVRDTRWASQIVFKNVVLAVLMPNQIGSGNMTPCAPGRLQPNTRLPKRFRRKNQIRRNHTIFQDLLLVVNVVDEDVQGMNALAKTTIDDGPFIGSHDSGNDVEGKDTLRTFLIAINVKSDAHAEQGLLGRLLIEPQLSVIER